MMSYRRKSAKPTNRRCMNLKPSQVLEDGRGEEDSDEEQLTIPPDLFHDFLQLKSTTHLNTTQLMRKLLKEYSNQRVSGSESDHEEKLNNCNYNNQNSDSRQVLADSSYEVIAESHISRASPPEENMDFDQPLDLTVEKTPNHSRGGSPTSNNQHYIQKLSPLSMLLPTIPMRNNHLPFVKSEFQLPMSLPIKTEPVMPSSTSCATFTTSLATPENFAELSNQLLLNGIGNLIAVPFVPSAQVQGLSSIPVPVKTEPEVSSTLTQIVSPPKRMKPGRKPRGGGASRLQKQPNNGEMKIIAENTLFPGVYTSILKLPWSRRSRNKPPLTAAPPTTYVPPSTGMHTAISIPSPMLSQSTANPNNTLLLPASSQTIMSATTSQSVMMVYPNATISAVGKPVRRRGRPPKLPMLSHLLSEKKVKKTTADTHVTNVTDRILPIPTALSESAPLISGGQLPPMSSQFEIPTMIKVEPSLSTPSSHSPSLISVTDSPISTVDTNGSIYHEMVLSSKSNQLVSIRPRRRQSTEVKQGSDFMWTSFKIKPRGGKTSSRRKKPIVNLEAGMPEVEMDVSQTEMEIDEDANSPSMFQELFHCKICNAILPADGKLEHQKEHQPTMLKCSSCHAPFLRYLHKDNDADKGKLMCDRCSRCTSANGNLNLNGNNFQCDLCEGTFKSFHAFNDHRHKVHGNEKITLDTHSCEECGKIFFTTKGLNHHMKTHSDKTKSQPIENGSKLFHSSHDESLDENEKEEYVCSLDNCNMKFQNISQLQEHEHIKHSTDRQHICPWPGCNKDFTAERHLKVHILIHKDEKPMKCDFCEYRCRQRNALNWHMRKHPESAYKYRKYPATLGGE